MKMSNIKPLFPRINGENVYVLTQAEYLTGAEKALIFDLQYLCGVGSNALANPETGQYMSIGGMARELKRDRISVSKWVTSLLRKGIILQIINRQEIEKYGRPVTERPLFLNPEIVFRGDPERISGNLCRLVLENDVLENSGILLERKVSTTPWLKPGACRERS
ncbi:hypothetical protein CEB3_c21380 [Peptococcaceae bacterium CEB3]|nr:hypothetical protein CEB3_c21380 [Peptococcaceae bacterium CEB3]